MRRSEVAEPNPEKTLCTLLLGGFFLLSFSFSSFSSRSKNAVETPPVRKTLDCDEKPWMQGSAPEATIELDVPPCLSTQ